MKCYARISCQTSSVSLVLYHSKCNVTLQVTLAQGFLTLYSYIFKKYSFSLKNYTLETISEHLYCGFGANFLHKYMGFF